MSGPGSQGGSVFNIGSQQAGAIYQSAGDQFIQRGDGTLSLSLLGAVSDIRSALRGSAASLPRHEQEDASRSLDVVEAELRRGEPDKPRIARALERVAGILSRAEGLATAAESFHQLAMWLGPAGLALVQMIL